MTPDNDLELTRPRSPRSLIAGLAVIALISLAFWRWGGPVVHLFRDQERIQAWITGFGPLAPLASVLLNAAQVLLAMVPAQVVGLASGYLFGVFWGTVYSMAGIILGSALAMGLGRWLGRALLLRWVAPERLARWDALLLRRGPRFFFLIFLLPMLPDDVLCFVIGLGPLSIPYVLALAAIGRLPGVVASNWIGANASGLSPAGWALLGGAALALAWSVLRYQAQIEAAMLRLAERLEKREKN